MARFFAFFLLLFLLFGSKASATSWLPMPDIMVITDSDLIVVGEVHDGLLKDYIKPLNILKGKAGQDELDIGKFPSTDESNFRCAWELHNGDKAIFFLKKDGEGKYTLPCAPFYRKSTDEEEKIRNLIKVEASPHEYINQPQFAKSEDMAYLLGELFKSFQFKAPKEPVMEKVYNRLNFSYWEFVDWGIDKPIPLKCTWKKDGMGFYFENEFSQSAFGNHLHYFSNELNWKEYGMTFKGECEVIIDATKSKESRGISRKAAISYLLSAIQSEDQNVAYQAFKSLEKMREASAVGPVIKLLKDKITPSKVAIQFLANSKSKQATPLLKSLLKDKNLNDEYGELKQSVIMAIAAIEGKNGVDSYTWAIQENIGVSMASHFLGEYGGKEHFEILLNLYSKENCEFDGLINLVKRSNLELQDWMNLHSRTCGAPPPDLGRWQNWWQQNKDKFEMAG